MRSKRHYRCVRSDCTIDMYFLFSTMYPKGWFYRLSVSVNRIYAWTTISRDTRNKSFFLHGQRHDEYYRLFRTRNAREMFGSVLEM